jgi:chaperonin GroES
VTTLFTVQVGNKVLISKYGGTEVKLNGDDVLIINETDILGIIA